MKKLFLSFCFVISALGIGFSCNSSNSRLNSSASDTSTIISLGIRMAISDRYMPGASNVFKPYRFKDSVVFTSENILLKMLPTRESDQNFKILPESEIKALLLADSLRDGLPNYLKIAAFEKNDSGYYILFENLSAFPFGGGGSLGITCKKIGDSIHLLKSSSGSIN